MRLVWGGMKEEEPPGGHHQFINWGKTKKELHPSKFNTPKKLGSRFFFGKASVRNGLDFHEEDRGKGLMEASQSWLGLLLLLTFV